MSKRRDWWTFWKQQQGHRVRTQKQQAVIKSVSIGVLKAKIALCLFCRMRDRMRDRFAPCGPGGASKRDSCISSGVGEGDAAAGLDGRW